VGRGRAGTEPDRPQSVLGHLVNHGVGVAKLGGQGRDAVHVADQAQRQGCQLAGVIVVRVQQAADFLIRPVFMQKLGQLLRIALFQRLANQCDKLFGVYLYHMFTEIV